MNEPTQTASAAPVDYCGEIRTRRFGLFNLAYVCGRRYLEIKWLGVWHRV